MLGHSMGTLGSLEFLCKRRKQPGGSGGCSPRNFERPRSIGSEAISGHTIALNQEHSHYAFGTDLCAV